MTRVLAGLTPRERALRRKRFGHGKSAGQTLEEAGRRYSVTRERLRRIEARALRKLARNNPEST